MENYLAEEAFVIQIGFAIDLVLQIFWCSFIHELNCSWSLAKCSPGHDRFIRQHFVLKHYFVTLLSTHWGFCILMSNLVIEKQFSFQRLFIDWWVLCRCWLLQVCRIQAMSFMMLDYVSELSGLSQNFK